MTQAVRAIFLRAFSHQFYGSNVLNLNPRTILHDNQALMRYELLYTPTDLGKASPGLTGVRDEVNDI